MMTLPVEEILEDLKQGLRTGPNVVLVAPPGAGKTTRLPLALMSETWLQGRRLLMLEPRRMAARAAAARMAATLGEPVGQTVGFRTRDDSRVSAATRIEVVTEGILTRLLLDDPALERYGLVIFDEFHERSIQADTGLALVRESQQVLRQDLRILVMSATLDGAAVAGLLGDCPVIRSAGRSHPVDVRWQPGSGPWLDQAARTLASLVMERDGTILVFLPGVREIVQLAARLPDLPSGTTLFHLHGGLEAAEQDRVLAPLASGERRVVLATSIAETSLTLPQVSTVLDCGYERGPRFDPGSGMSRLVTRRVSRATAEQRAGRAGREAPGVAVRLWAESETLAAFSPPEILQADLAGLALDLVRWGCREPGELAWLDVPPHPAWRQALALLRELGALDGNGLTQRGRDIQSLPLHPRLGAMVLAGRERGLGRLAARLAVVLEENGRLPGEGADLERRLRRLDEDPGRLRHLQMRWRRLTPRDTPDDVDQPDAVARLLAVAWPDRVALRRRGSEPRFLLANGRGAWLPADDPLAGAPALVAAQLDGEAREARVYLAAALAPGLVEDIFPDRITHEDRVEWDQGAGLVRARRERRFGALVLGEEPLAQPPVEAVTAALLDGLRRSGIGALPWTPALRQWQARVCLMAKLEPERWPALDDDWLSDNPEHWAVPFLGPCIASRRWNSFPLAAALHSQLDHSRQVQLDSLLPTSLEVPTGTRVTLDYLQATPVLAVKLQEMFGLGQTPCLAGGRVPLLLHLLSPARRPVAVTADLASFWKQGYPQVRKDLRGRYPKHPWPEDPVTAIPQAGTRRRSSGQTQKE